MTGSDHNSVDVSVDVVCQRVAASASCRDRHSRGYPFDKRQAGSEKALRNKRGRQRRENEKVPDLGLRILVIG